jgi:VWFA-related protein
VAGLGLDDFEVFDNGRRVVTVVDENQSLLRIILLVQNNRGVARANTRVRKVGSLLTAMVGGAGAQIAVISFSDQARPVSDFTGDEHKTAEAIRDIPLIGTGNALIDALHCCAERFDGAGRRVIVVIGEARDRDSQTKYDAVRDELLRKSCEVSFLTYSAYAMPFTGRPVYECPPKKPGCREDEREAVAPEPPRGIFGELKRLRSVNIAADLAQRTGGEVLHFYSQDAIDTALQRIGRNLHEGYMLAFAPAVREGEAKGFREITVRMKNPTYTAMHRRQYHYE